MKDYYAILGVEKDASARSIQRAYRRLARSFHPDLHQGSKEKEERFKEVAAAYAVLGNPEKRSLYDRRGGPESGEDWLLDNKCPSFVNTEGIIASFMELLRNWDGKKGSPGG